MSFKTQQSSSVMGPKNLELKKKTLREEIGVLGIRFGETKRDLLEIKARRAKVKDVKEELERLEEKKKKLQVKVDSLDEQVEEKEKSLFVLKGKLSIEQKNIEKKSSEDRAKAERELSALKKTIEIAEKDLSELNKKKEGVEKQKEILKKEVQGFEESKKTLQKEVEELEKTKGTLAKEKKVVVAIKGKIDSLANDKTSLDKEIKKIKEEKLEALADYNAQKMKFDKFNQESSKIMEEFEEKMAKRTKELEEKAGLVSEKESWIKGKENDLRKAKAEMERHFNKKITHIII